MQLGMVVGAITYGIGAASRAKAEAIDTTHQSGLSSHSYEGYQQYRNTLHRKVLRAAGFGSLKVPRKLSSQIHPPFCVLNLVSSSF
jgi:hypothetical protein